jgi:hypothetical protein
VRVIWSFCSWLIMASASFVEWRLFAY